ncbi:hypothetical protein OB13_02315 [Pontibacter sp. HJ8]
MNTKILMTTSALLQGSAGLALTFLPDELLSLAGIEYSVPLLLILQVLGALYFAFGMLNWMMKTGRIGGIYNRPIAVANCAHFSIAGLALIKAVLSEPGLPILIWVAAVGYTLLAIGYSIVLFRHPLAVSKTT